MKEFPQLLRFPFNRSSFLLLLLPEMRFGKHAFFTRSALNDIVHLSTFFVFPQRSPGVGRK